MIRKLLLYLSRNQGLRDFVVRFALSRRVARRFVAGETLDEAVAVVQELNSRAVVATVDHLGENVLSEEEARRAAEKYHRILDRIQQSGVASNVSLKLTQMGLDLSRDLCLENVEGIVARAKNHGNFVRLDMEGSPHTERTLQVYERLRRDYDNVGVTMQSYLYRTEDDVRRLLPLGLNIRLCKGAYDEPPHIAYPRKRDVDASFVRLMELMFSPEARAQGAYLAIATHDERLINWAREYVAEHDIGRDAFEFQMLYGIRRDLQSRLAAEGYRVRVYVPYGAHWYPYFMRRLAERPANMLFLVKNVIRD